MRRPLWSAPFVATFAALPACEAPPAAAPTSVPVASATVAPPTASAEVTPSASTDAGAVATAPDPVALAWADAAVAPTATATAPRPPLPKYPGFGQVWRDQSGRCWYRPPMGPLPNNYCKPNKPCMPPNPPPPHEIECPVPWPANASGGSNDLPF